MRQGSWCLVVIAVVILAVALAGCTSLNNSGNTKSSGTGSSGSSAGGSAASASGGGDCPTVDAAHSWNGKWESQANSDRCYDMRKLFYPGTQNNPTPWESMRGFAMDMPVTFTQTGCDVTGSITIGTRGIEPKGCPITLTGKVDKNNVLTGTWKAYCGLVFGPAINSKKDESGVFSLLMDPAGYEFTGTIQGDNPEIAKTVAKSCPEANGNWVGKRG